MKISKNITIRNIDENNLKILKLPQLSNFSNNNKIKTKEDDDAYNQIT